MRRGVVAPFLVMGAGLSISCTVPRLATEVSNVSSSVRRVEVEARGNERIELAVDLPPGGVAGVESWGKRPRSTVKAADERAERSLEKWGPLEIGDDGKLREGSGGRP